MRTDLAFDRLDDPFEPFVSDSDLIGYYKPSEIVHDPMLTLARKRQLLAYWGSDIHAVTGAPALRSCAFGATVSIDDIQDALRALDTMVDPVAMPKGTVSGVSA